MYIPSLPAAFVASLAVQNALVPKAPRAVSICPLTITTTNYALTHNIYTTYTGTLTILHTETTTVYSPTSGKPKPTHKDDKNKVVWGIPPHFPSTATPTPKPDPLAERDECILSITYGGTTTRTLTKFATATSTSTRIKTITVPVPISIPPLPPYLRPNTTPTPTSTDEAS